MAGALWEPSAREDADWLTLGDSAALLGVPEQTLRERIELGAIPRQLTRFIDGSLYLHPGIAPEPRSWRIPFMPAPVEKWWEQDETALADDPSGDPYAVAYVPPPAGVEWLSIAETANALGIQEHVLLQEIVLHHVPEPLVRIVDDTVQVHRSVGYPNRLAWEGARSSRTSGGSVAIAAAPAVPRGPGIGARIGTRVGQIAISQVLWLIGAMATLAVVGVIFFTNIGKNPAGFFADEAMIGVATHDLVHHKLGWFPPPFFYEHLGYHNTGALPLYAAAPFAAILGLSDFSMRLASVIWTMLAVVALIGMVRQLKWRFGEVGVIAFALTPVFIHFSRIQFGHAISLFCVSFGLYAWVRARQMSSWRWGIASGLLLGISMYGYGAYYFAAPIILGSLVLGEIVVNRQHVRAYRQVLFGILGFGLAALPVAYRALTDDSFIKRFHEKQGNRPTGSLSSILQNILDNYTKYFSFDYLFREGETGMPGGFNLRHSVPGSGELTWLLLPLILVGVVAVFRVKDPGSRAMGVAGLAMLVLYPVPDAISAAPASPPYTFTAFSLMIATPILAALGISWVWSLIGSQTRRRAVLQYVVPLGLLALMLLQGYRLWDGSYRNYPNVSAEYYGWQFGAGASLAAFEDHPGYDHYILDGDFNAAFIFLDFYYADNPEMRAISFINWPEYQADTRFTDLYAVRAERFNDIVQSGDLLRRHVKIIQVINYPNGTIAMYLVEIGPTDQWPGREVPR